MKLSKRVKMFSFAIVIMSVFAVCQSSSAGIEKIKLSDFADNVLYDDLNFTGQFVEVLDDRPTKFYEYRDIVAGPQAPIETLMLGSQNSPTYYYFDGFNLLRRDQSVLVEFGNPGKYKIAFEFNQIPHRYSRLTKTIEQDIAAGNYVVDVNTRTTLAGLAAPANQIRQLLAGFTERDMEVDRYRYNLEAGAWLTDSIQLDLSAGLEDRQGLRKKGSGTYMRTNDFFTVRGIELPEPIQYQTVDFGARLTYAIPNSITSLDWALSYFHNEVDELVWDNPFRVQDGAATGATGGNNRGNFNRGRLSLYPDNVANTITLSQAWTLPHKTNVATSLSYGIHMQDDAFLPYTSNSAINALAGFTADDTSRLPKLGLDGMANTLSETFTITNKAIDRLKAKFYLNTYGYLNNTDGITFPGYAAFGDSFWLTQITGDTITSQPPSFLDAKTGLKLDYELTKQISLISEYEGRYKRLKNRQVPNVLENTFKNGVEIKPWSFLKLESFFTFGLRGYYGKYYYHREFEQLRMFDQNDRKRNQIDGRMELTLNEWFTVGFSTLWRWDDFNAAYGLRETSAVNYSVDAECSPGGDNWSIYSYYSFDRGTFNMSSIAKSGTPYNAKNTWFSDTTENTNSLGAGIKYAVIPDKASLDISYAFSLAEQRFVNSTLLTTPENPDTASSWQWPAVRSNLQQIKTQFKYKLCKNADLKLFYNVELYDLNDFAWDGLQPYLEGQTIDDTSQYLWLDSRYSDYIAHVYGVTVKYVF